MTIETKYNLKNDVYFLYQNKVEKGYIQKIIYNTEVNVFDNSITKYIAYKVAINQNIIPEHFLGFKLFKTKKELLDSI